MSNIYVNKRKHSIKVIRASCKLLISLHACIVWWRLSAMFNTTSPEKWLHNWICYPSNRSKQIQETQMAYSAGTQYTRQSFNKSQHTWLHWQQDIVCEAMYAVCHSNFAAYIVCRRYKPCEFLGFVWTDCWGNKSNYIITFTANIRRFSF